MKQGWEIKKLGEICNKITNIKWNEIDKTTSFPYIDLSAVDRENSSIHDYEYINISNAPSRAKQIVKVGDILFATTRPMLKRACIIPNEFNNAIASTGFCVLRPQGTVLSEWIYHNIKSNRFYKYIEPIQKGVSYPAVTDNEVKDFCIPVPPREEQEGIVEELDCLSGVIERKREQLRELDALAQSIFYQMFGDPITNEKGWEVKEVKDVAPQQEYKGDVPCVDGKYWLLNLDMVIPNTGEIIEKSYFDYDEIGNSTIIFNTDNVLYSKLRPYLNKVVIPNDIGYGTSELVPLKPHKDLLNKVFFASLLRSSYFVKYISGKVAGAKMPRVAMGEFREFAVILPPLALQQEFAEKIDAIEKQKELIKQSITQTEELFNSRMDYYFN